MKLIKTLGVFFTALFLFSTQAMAFTNTGDYLRPRGWVNPNIYGNFNLIDPDVAHGMTGIFPTDVYGSFRILNATNGGLRIYGASDEASTTALHMECIIGVADPTDTQPCIKLAGYKKSGTLAITLGSAETVMQVLNGTTPLVTVLGDGDTLFGTVATPRLTIGGGTNDDGLTFGSLGTATKAIDLSANNLSGDTDYQLYLSASNYWTASGIIAAGTNLKLLANSTNAILAGNGVAIGSLTSVTSNGTTTLTKVAHGLSVAAGDLVHITGATTTADKGIYTLQSSTADTLVVDHALSGSDSDVALTVYKDVIGIFATDGTNGQRIMNYSHQNKPLQIGRHVLATSTGYTSEDVTLGGALWVDSSTGYVRIGDGTAVPGKSLDVAGTIRSSVAEASNSRSYFDTPEGIAISRYTTGYEYAGLLSNVSGSYNPFPRYAISIDDASTGNLFIGTRDTADLGFSTDDNLRMLITSGGNVLINATVFGTSLANGLAMGNGTAATAVLANGWQVWSADFLGGAGDARMHIMGEGSANARTILGSGKVTVQGTTGGVTKQIAEATATLSGASTTIQTNVTSGSRIIAVQLRVDTLITSGDGGTTWTAVFVNVPTTAITSGQAFTKNTKFSKVTADEIATGEVDITITPNSGTFSAGVVRAIITYELYDAMADAA